MASLHCVFSSEIKGLFSLQNSCYNDHIETAFYHYVLSDDLQIVISMQISCHNTHTEMASHHYVFLMTYKM